MKTSKRSMQVLLAGIIGMGAVITSAMAQGDTLVTLCFRNRTVQIPTYLVPRYLAQPGTTPGPCQTTQ